MRRYRLFVLAIFLFTLCASPAKGQERGDPVANALAEGNDFLKQRDYDRALAAYRKGDKLSHHTCADCFLGIFRVDRELGDLQAALDDVKQAVKAAGSDQAKASQAHLARGTLLAQMAWKPNDKKLREAESEARQALALAPEMGIAHFDLGKILLRQERDSEGIVELKTYLATADVNPKSALEARRIIANPIRGREPFAPDFSFVTLEGERLSNAAVRGKVVLFDFWGAWCPYCRESVPVLLNVQKKYRDRPFQIVGVSSDEDEKLWKSFLASHHMDWPEYLDSSSAVRQAFEINSFPTLILLDRDGVITYNQSGWSPMLPMELEEAINKALKRPSNPTVLAAAAASMPEEPAPGRAPDANLTGTRKLAKNPPDVGASAENDVVSGNVYRDEVVGFSYRLPQNWVVAAPEIVRAAAENSKADFRAKFLEQHPGQDATKISIATVVFYASQSGQGDGRQLFAPCVRISVLPWNRPSISLGEVKAWQERSAPAGWSFSQGPEEYNLKDQQFFRTDFVNADQSHPLFASQIVTVTHGHLLRVEILSLDKEELGRLSLSFNS